jgi:hypothetical protein
MPVAGWPEIVLPQRDGAERSSDGASQDADEPVYGLNRRLILTTTARFARIGKRTACVSRCSENGISGSFEVHVVQIGDNRAAVFFRDVGELVKAYDEALVGWSRAMDARDKETEGHTQRTEGDRHRP